MPNYVEQELTEETALLPSAAPPTSSKPLAGEGSDSSNQSVTIIRAWCIIASLGLLIFLQGIPLMVMTIFTKAMALTASSSM